MASNHSLDRSFTTTLSTHSSPHLQVLDVGRRLGDGLGPLADLLLSVDADIQAVLDVGANTEDEPLLRRAGPLKHAKT